MFNKIVIAAAAATIALAGPVGVAGAASPFAGFGAGSLGSLSSLFPTPEVPGPGEPGPEQPGPVVPDGPTVTSSKSTALAAGDKITVSGTGFSGAGSGIYVGLIQDDKYSATDSTAWLTTTWLKPAQVVGGAWSVDIDVVAANDKGSDCTKNACSIYTVAAHGSPDRSQDTKTPVTFAP